MTLPRGDHQALEELVRATRDHGRFCAESLTIRNESGATVPLVLTPAQAKLTQCIRDQEKRGVPVRGVALKARQVRMSVGVATHIWRRCAFWPGQHGEVYGTFADTAAGLWDYYRQMDDSYKPFLGLRKLATVAQRHQSDIEWDMDSWIHFKSADSASAPRGKSIRHIHGSEVAFWRRYEELMTGLLQAVPDDPDTTVIMESTANGMGGPFYDLWRRAVEGRSSWFALFFAWHEEPKYSLSVEDPGAFERSLTDAEHELRIKYNLRLDQLKWRRWAISEKCEGSITRFHQEYPSCAEEAFLTSGRPRFDLGLLGRHKSIEPATGELDRVRVGTGTRVQFMTRGDGHGSVRIWEQPRPHAHYVIGADVAEGKDPNGDLGRSDPDYSVAQVLDRLSGRQVAMVRARLTPFTFADTLAALAEFYNWAVIVPEANGPGVAVIECLMKSEFPLHLLYRRDRSADDLRATRLEELGFRTDKNSRHNLISGVERALWQGQISVQCTITLMEMRTFVYRTDGKVAAQDGSHDDTVIALGLAVLGLSTPIPIQQRQVVAPGPVRYDTPRFIARRPSNPWEDR